MREGVSVKCAARSKGLARAILPAARRALLPGYRDHPRFPAIADLSRPQNPALRVTTTPLAALMFLALAACADKPIPPVNSYCVVKATETIDMRDPGLQGLWPSNQGAVLTADDNFRQLCQRTNSPGGPR